MCSISQTQCIQSGNFVVNLNLFSCTEVFASFTERVPTVVTSLSQCTHILYSFRSKRNDDVITM